MELYGSLRLGLRSKAAHAFGSLLRRYAPVSKGWQSALGHDRPCHDSPWLISQELNGHLQLLIATTT
jgi:hypothetical protein